MRLQNSFTDIFIAVLTNKTKLVYYIGVNKGGRAWLCPLAQSFADKKEKGFS